MSDKLTIANPLPWRSRALLAEAEEERLRAEVGRLNDVVRQMHEASLERRAEIERLQAQVAKHDTPGFVCQA